MSPTKPIYTARVALELADKLRAHGVVITGAPSSTFLSTILSWVLPIFLFYLIWTYGFRRVAERQGLGGLMSIGKSRAKVYVETDTKTTFRDVAGVDGAKFECRKWSRSCAIRCPLARRTVPKGILLVGTPGDQSWEAGAVGPAPVGLKAEIMTIRYRTGTLAVTFSSLLD
jgi:cell division protease FtsH